MLQEIGGDRSTTLSGSGEALLGVACLLFGAGTHGAGGLARLARSSWFKGLEPRAEDLVISGGVSCGSWAMPDGSAAGAAAEIEAFGVSDSLPSAWLAMVAVPWGAGPAEQSAALGLIGAFGRAAIRADGRWAWW